jgi:hypothetical protein
MAKFCQINRVKQCFDRNTLTNIISTLVLSKLYYCSSVWANTSTGNINYEITGSPEFRMPTEIRRLKQALDNELKQLPFGSFKKKMNTILTRDSFLVHIVGFTVTLMHY